MKEKYILEVLRSIAAHDGEWSWFQLDRMLSAQGLIAPEPLPALLREIEARGLIASRPGPSSAQPVYVVTPEGRERLLAEGSRPAGADSRS